MSVPEGVFTGSWHEQDPRWTAVDRYTQSHLHPSAKPYHEALNAALIHSRVEDPPDIATHPVFSKAMALQCLAGKVSNALEVGALGGYTSIWIAVMNPNIHIDSIEIDEKHARVATENLKRAGVSDRVKVTLGAGLDVLPRMLDEIKQGSRSPIGFTYIDADKPNNWAYFDLAVQMSSPGAMIYIDNIVQRGGLAQELVDADEDERESIEGARLVVEKVGKDKRVEAVVQQTVAEKSYDGYLMAVVL